MQVLKDADAKLDYAVDWTTWLVDGDTIAASEWIIPDGLEADNETHTPTTATVWLAGGNEGQSLKVTNRITTAQGRVDDRSITLRIVHR